MSELGLHATVPVPGEGGKDFADDAPLLVLDAVPTEILCYIFHLTLPWHRRIWRPSGDDELVSTPPWRLGFVCRRWRESAIGDPSLWSTIVIEYPRGLSITQIEERYPLAALEAQLARSGAALLDATLTTWARGEHEVALAAHLLGRLAVLVRHSRRWEGFSFEWNTSLMPDSPSPDLPLLLALVTGRFPHLRRLQFVSNGKLPLETSEVFRVTPQLREVFTTEADRHPDLSAPWEQTTDFRVGLDRSLHLAILEPNTWLSAA
ncbi:hypothetical protein C8R46DRAFT_1057151 [Mycena filopes]|nr:hypothetical protein C8R46DRAFT_1057151 [Mycena filopes]